MHITWTIKETITVVDIAIDSSVLYLANANTLDLVAITPAYYDYNRKMYCIIGAILPMNFIGILAAKYLLRQSLGRLVNTRHISFEFEETYKFLSDLQYAHDGVMVSKSIPNADKLKVFKNRYHYLKLGVTNVG